MVACGKLARRDLEVGIKSRVIGYAHAETAELGEQAETHVRFRDAIGLLAVNLRDAGVRHRVGSRGGLRRARGARCDSGLGVANEPAALTYWT